MILRANDLSLINGVQYLRLYKELSRQGWLKKEPYEFDSESPQILSAVFENMKIAKGIDHREIAHTLGWTPQTLTEITGVRAMESRTNVRALIAKRTEA